MRPDVGEFIRRTLTASRDDAPQAAQDLRIGCRSSNAFYQYTIQSDDLDDLSRGGPVLLAEMKKREAADGTNSTAASQLPRTDGHLPEDFS